MVRLEPACLTEDEGCGIRVLADTILQGEFALQMVLLVGCNVRVFHLGLQILEGQNCKFHDPKDLRSLFFAVGTLAAAGEFGRHKLQ